MIRQSIYSSGVKIYDRTLHTASHETGRRATAFATPTKVASRAKMKVPGGNGVAIPHVYLPLHPYALLIEYWRRVSQSEGETELRAHASSKRENTNSPHSPTSPSQVFVVDSDGCLYGFC